MRRKYTPVVVKEGRWFVAYAEELPGVTAQGKTKVVAMRNLEQAMGMVNEANLEFAAAAISRAARRSKSRD